MKRTKYVVYRRVSTARQGDSGLGLAAQKRAIKKYIREHPGRVIASFTEVESGGNNARPKLAKAVRRARVTGAVLLVAKLDRLARDAFFLRSLQNSGVGMAFADMPGADDMTVKLLADVGERELKMIRGRVSDAMQELKSNGKLLGTAVPGHKQRIKAKIEATIGWDKHLATMRERGTAAIRAKWEQRRADAYDDYLPKIKKRRERGDSLQSICDWLNTTKCPTASGVDKGKRFYPNTIRRLLESMPTETSFSNS